MPITIRTVSAADKKDILELSRHTWDGYDYLPFVIDEWLEDPDSYIYGVEESRRLIALANIRLVDGGQTGWMEGLRVHPDSRLKGYAHALTRELLEKARGLGVIRLRYTTSTENEASLKLAGKYGFVRILEKSVFWRPTLGPKILDADRFATRVSSPAEVYAAVQTNLNLVRNRILVFDWKALDFTREALEILGRNHRFFVAPKEQGVDSLSYGTLRHRGQTLLWVFTIHAAKPAGFLSHLSGNVVAASALECSAIMGTCDVEFEKAFRDVDWGPEERWGTRLVLLEKMLR